MKINLIYFISILALFGTLDCKKDDANTTPQNKITIAGDTYHIVRICNQEWLMENLRATRDRDNKPIRNVVDGQEWANLEVGEGAFCYYNNDVNFSKTYGNLYNWSALVNIAPSGWHVPTIEDFEQLASCVGGDQIAGVKLKEAGSDHWEYDSPNEIGTNDFSFTALPGGYRELAPNNNSYFGEVGTSGRWWTSSASTDTLVFANQDTMFNIVHVSDINYLELDWNRRSSHTIKFSPTNHFKVGYSVRLVKD